MTTNWPSSREKILIKLFFELVTRCVAIYDFGHKLLFMLTPSEIGHLVTLENYFLSEFFFPNFFFARASAQANLSLSLFVSLTQLTTQYTRAQG